MQPNAQVESHNKQTPVEPLEQPAQKAKAALARIAEETKTAAERATTAARTNPALGAVVVGGAIALVAGLWGATEAAVVAIAGYAFYRVFKRERRAHEHGEHLGLGGHPKSGGPSTGPA